MTCHGHIGNRHTCREKQKVLNLETPLCHKSSTQNRLAVYGCHGLSNTTCMNGLFRLSSIRRGLATPVDEIPGFHAKKCFAVFSFAANVTNSYPFMAKHHILDISRSGILHD